MPASNDSASMTIPDKDGDAVLAVAIYFNRSSGTLFNSAASFLSATGKLWQSGRCVYIDNESGAAVKLSVAEDNGKTRMLDVPVSGRTFSAKQLAALTPPLLTIDQFAGLKFVVS